MKLEALGIIYDNGSIKVLDQRQLPKKEIWTESNTINDMCDCINSLKVRGAPLIGIAALFSLGQYFQAGATKPQLLEAAKTLVATRPTAVNLKNYINYFCSKLNDNASNVLDIVAKIFHEDIVLCKRMAAYGLELFGPNEIILTYCNTGGLATAGEGTALGVIKSGYKNKKIKHVFVCETRPLLQGARLTTWELEKAKIPYTLICDNMAAFLMQQKKIDRVLTGADHIALNGDTANKIGTYNLAVLANFHNVPFHVVAPITTFDLSCYSGSSINIEERKPEEVRGMELFGSWSPETANVYNPSFDITPGSLVTSFICDRGIFKAENLRMDLKIA